jgi:hypothetical protein
VHIFGEECFARFGSALAAVGNSCRCHAPFVSHVHIFGGESFAGFGSALAAVGWAGVQQKAPVGRFDASSGHSGFSKLKLNC